MCDDGSSEFLRLLASNFGTAALDGKNEVLDTKDPLLNRGMKTLKCPKCNWHYKYHETLEIHMKEKHAQSEVACVYCNDNVQHPKLARGETYSCGYKPYRCELCKYSTTTKGNLSIHMQSDKHLHALNELPANIASLQSVATFAQTASTNERLFKCVLCNYACDAVDEMVAHMDKDRSRPAAGDVLLLNGTFRCQLCPYTTNLKANFQLHTRTDKHLQRVQLVNHIRERTSSAPVALSAVKSSLCVLCRVCDQVLSSVNCLREHVSSLQHNANLRQTATLSCRLCSFETSLMSEAIGHLCNHEAVTWPHDRLAKMNVSMEDDAAYACASCGFATKDAKSLEEHAMTHEEGELCPLCPQRTQQLCEHLVQDHKIAESAVERLLATQKDTSTYAFRCEDCSMAFRSQESLQMHQVAHLFQTTHKCTHCAFEASDAQTLQAHVETHESQRCQLCRQTFSTTQLFVEHLNSVAHLHRAKQQLEQNAADLSSQCLSLQNAASPSEFSKPFRCNVCNIGYAQGATLDIHLRSVAHQSRMSKLGELVATGEVDSSRPVLEQPAGPAQRLIREVIAEDDEPKVTDSSALTMLNVMNMLMSGTNNNEAATSNNSDDSPTDFKSQLDSFGIDRVCEACPELREFVHDLWRLSKEQCEDLVNVTCDLCSTTVELQQLQQHHEETHAAAPSTRCLAALGTRIVSVLGQPAATNEPAAKRARTQNEADFSQMAMLNMMGNSFPFMGINHMAFEQFFNPLMHQIHNSQSPSPAKRARTRITDDQLKILRQYFDINNSPSEAQIKEMSEKAALPEKVIKHWFRNTLFKERQRDKDSPYNFSVPPQMGIDLATYEKTGETKVVELTPEMKVKCDSSREKKPSIVDTSPLQQMMQQMSNSAMHLFDSSLMPAALNVSSTSARRANRTRFTDSQLRTLQNFFEKQAYPKDDDLEALSKKLQLNPRVIVVWFQNQRQKARKVYENQPNHENGERFARTPECNFQCKRCNVVFQRYYELIQHQQSKCYKDDGDAQARDNKMLDVTLADEEKSRSSQERTTVEVKPSVEVKPPTNDLARLFADSSTEALLKMCESVGQSTSAQKECPFCGVLCETTSLLQHMLTEHMQKEFSNDGALDLSTNSLDVGESLSVSPFERGLDSDVDCDEPTTATSATAASSLSAASPAIKRYRTHLTPTQVHVMKRIFAFYKTPSMSECEALGREVSLHKRVVQVWFQNSRAKHRKQVPVNEALEEESSSTFCALCNVQYNARNTMQDHIFSSAHIGQLKAQLNNFSNGEENNVDKSKKISKSERSPSMNAFNFEMMLPQALPLLYDATLMQGTSVELLQIPDSVKRQIRSDMDSGQTSTTFTQDGLSIEQAQKMLGDLAPMMSDSQRQVGWACSQCSKVLQSSPLLSAHQHTVCRVGGEFGLHQVHYDCRKCNASFGRVLELRTHLESCTERLASA